LFQARVANIFSVFIPRIAAVSDNLDAWPRIKFGASRLIKCHYDKFTPILGLLVGASCIEQNSTITAAQSAAV